MQTTRLTDQVEGLIRESNHGSGPYGD